MENKPRTAQTQRRTPAKKAGVTSVSAEQHAKQTGKRTDALRGRPLTPAQRRKLARRRAVREPRFITVRKRRHERKPFPFGVVLVLSVITALFLFMMMNYAEIDQYNGEIRDLRNELAEMQAEQKKLEVRLKNKDDRNAYEQYATEQLGMVKADSLDKYFVTLSPEDKTEIMEYDEEEDSGFGYLLSGLAEVVRGFFEENGES